MGLPLPQLYQPIKDQSRDDKTSKVKVMANHCSNWIKVSGDETRINEFFSELEKYLTDSCMINLEAVWASIGGGDYGNLVDEFGSKWVELHEYDEVEIDCTSAWSPPIGLFAYWSDKFKINFGIGYAESGCDFGGYCYIHEGAILEDSQTDYWGYFAEYDPDFINYNFMDEAEYFESLDEFKRSGIYEYLDREQTLEVEQFYQNEKEPI